MLHKTEAERPRLPGDEGFWYFFSLDLVLFFLLFGSFLHDRSQDLASFIRPHGIADAIIPTVNTAFLLTGSYFAALAVKDARRGLGGMARRKLGVALLFAAGFILLKLIEYYLKREHFPYLQSDPYFAYYLAITFLHLMHVIGSAGFLVYIWFNLPAQIGERETRMVESGAAFWHIVDILWVVIFPLIYLI